MRFKILQILLLTLGFTFPVVAAELLTNSAHFSNAPKWLTSTKVNKVADSVGSFLEWDIHRVEVVWYDNQSSFENAHGLGPLVLALSRRNESKILIGPRVTPENFEQIFGHELVHVIVYQKYKEAIPKWLEEGLANYITKASKVDYIWLSHHAFPEDVRKLLHPFAGSEDHIHYHYYASQALTEMIAAKCDFKNLLRLSVGRDMDRYLDTYCNIKDLNLAFHKWVEDHGNAIKK
jgi:hypothetical protein